MRTLQAFRPEFIEHCERLAISVAAFVDLQDQSPVNRTRDCHRVAAARSTSARISSPPHRWSVRSSRMPVFTTVRPLDGCGLIISDVGVTEGDVCQNVPVVDGGNSPARDLDVLLRHQLQRIGRLAPQERRKGRHRHLRLRVLPKPPESRRRKLDLGQPRLGLSPEPLQPSSRCSGEPLIPVLAMSSQTLRASGRATTRIPVANIRASVRWPALRAPGIACNRCGT